MNNLIREYTLQEWKDKLNATEGICPECGKSAFGTTYCSTECFRLSSRKVKARPSKQELNIMAKTMSICAIGRLYEVSDNAVRKWMK